jgi:hypothetical protein
MLNLITDKLQNIKDLNIDDIADRFGRPGKRFQVCLSDNSFINLVRRTL